jgi:nicotinamidase-related amidase
MTTTFTPENSALVLIDHQVGTMQLIKNIDVAQARRMSLALAKTARILGIPTVRTSSQENRVQGPLLHELKDILPDAFDASSAKASSTPGPTPTSRRLSKRRGGRI